MKIHLDFETRSTVDLRKTGAHIYAEDKTTDVLCAAYRFDDGQIFLWKYGDPKPHSLIAGIEKGFIVVAHNAAFEHAIWNGVCVKKYGWPHLPLTQMDCTMIRSYAMGLPGTLENASKAVGIKDKKASVLAT